MGRAAWRLPTTGSGRTHVTDPLREPSDVAPVGLARAVSAVGGGRAASPLGVTQSMLRRCFKDPIPEFALAADLLSRAADALLADNLELCSNLLVQADLPALREFAYEVAGPINPAIHRQSAYPTFVPVPKEAMPRMPSKSDQRAVMVRDGYRCRFCESRVILSAAHRIFADALPKQARLGKTNDSTHFGLSTLTASIDHLVPYARGGGNDPSNLVTACGPCQYGRFSWTLEEVEIENPWNYPAIVDGWDGLSRLLPLEKRRGRRKTSGA